MATELASAPPATSQAEDLGLDRDFLRVLARVPFIALGMMLAALLGQQLSPLVPVVLLCVGMILAAVIDGIAFKVPNWLTLSMILAGWGIGAINSFGVTVGPGPIEAAFRGDFPASG